MILCIAFYSPLLSINFSSITIVGKYMFFFVLSQPPVYIFAEPFSHPFDGET